MASEFHMNNVFRGDFIIAQAEVIFFKRKKKKKKQPTPQRCILLITHDTVALTDPQKEGKAVLMFPRNTITNLRYNDNTDDHFDQYKLEISVWIMSKTHELCIEFPTDDAKDQRQIFIQHFTEDKAKPIDDKDPEPNANTNNNTHSVAPPPAQQQQQQQLQPVKQQVPKPQVSQTVNGSSSSTTAAQSKRRGTKRKHESIMNEETLRQRACKLAKNKYLATLYKTLVGKNVLTPDEFWNEYGKDIDIKRTSNGLIQGLPNTVLSSTMQREPWSLFSLFKDDIDNQQNEDNEHKNKLTIHLTAEKILEIFLHLPEVKLAYQRHVPCHFTEDEFWKAFLQSHYFKRGTTRNVTSGISDKETQIDKLLKTYSVQLQHEHNQSNDVKSDSNMRAHKQNEINSFAKQLAAMQLAKNKEVDVEGKLKQMREEIAAARAAKQGGDIQKFVEQIDNGMIRVNDGQNAQTHDTDVKMKDVQKNHNKHTNEEDTNKISEQHFKKKVNQLDPSVDLTATMDSFTEIIEDPGSEEMRSNLRREDIETWLGQINKHGTMLLYQSLNQNNAQRNRTQSKHHKPAIQDTVCHIPKVNYGREYKTDLVFGDDVDRDDNHNNMRYEDRLRKETELNDLKKESEAKCIELKIKDQSVYWGDDLLLTEGQRKRMNQEAKELNGYLEKVALKKKKISELPIANLIQSKYVDQVIVTNTQNNAATGSAYLMSQRVRENNDKQKVLMIYGQEKDIKAHHRILDQLSAFQKPMKELVRHYWNCFPANKHRLNKSKILVNNLKEYKMKLVSFRGNLAGRNNSDLKKQIVLLRELIELADKVLEHHETTEKSLEKKQANRKQILDSSNANDTS